MKLKIHLIAIVLILNLVGCTSKSHQTKVLSPDGTIEVIISKKNDSIQYTIHKNGVQILEESKLGLSLNDNSSLDKLIWTGESELEVIQFDYTLYHGKRLKNRYVANKRTVFLEGEENRKIHILFQVSNDGVGFKYIFPENLKDTLKIEQELTSFHFHETTHAWLQPMSMAKTGWNRTNPSYEENYYVNVTVGTTSPTIAGWAYPALFKVKENWVLITEAGLKKNYCGTRLKQTSDNGVYQIGFPQKEEGIFGGPVFPESTLPWESPWRVITIGSLKTIVESNHGNALAEPAIDIDSNFIKPGYASWSWALLKDPSITYEIQKQFIDYAANMEWPYCLVDVNWDTTIGYNKIKELSNYAKSKKVGLILWYNSAGDWNDVTFHPKDKLLTKENRSNEFKILNEMGIAGVKIDFFGGDGQSVIEYYHNILIDAAQYKLLVNFHGATLPRGWHRTYPNLMTMESVKGFEFITFEQENADLGPEHCTILPFTRNVFDPMDFTPMNLTSIPNIERRSSPAFELALPVLFLSGIQHIAETAKGMATMPEYIRVYLRGIPTAWDDSKFLAGFPGKYVVVARKKDKTWFISGINAQEEAIEIDLDLSFIGKDAGVIIKDGESEDFSWEEIDLSSDAKILVKIDPMGGFVAKF